MKITVLIDNRCSRADLVAEHGLSLFIETDAHRILVDTGLSGKAFDNAEKLGIDIQTVDYLVLSHGHIDHTGGLRRFVVVNHTARIVVSRLVLNYQYFSNRGGKLHSLSPDEDVIRQNMERFVFVDDNYQIDSGICAVFTRNANYPQPNGNRYLSIGGDGSMPRYIAADEIALCLNNDGGLTIVSPCSHRGLLNIADDCCNYMKNNNLTAFVGGLHLLDGECDDLEALSSTFITKYPSAHLYTGHCTGDGVCETLGGRLKGRFHLFGTGDFLTTN